MRRNYSQTLPIQHSKLDDMEDSQSQKNAKEATNSDCESGDKH